MYLPFLSFQSLNYQLKKIIRLLYKFFLSFSVMAKLKKKIFNAFLYPKYCVNFLTQFDLVHFLPPVGYTNDTFRNIVMK